MATDDGGTTEQLTVDEIDGTFAPRPVPDIATVELDGEVVLGVRDADNLRTYCLNRIGGIVWSCLDGEATLDELVDDLSDAFEADREVVANDVLELTRQLGMIGLLEGLKPFFPAAAWDDPQGLSVGDDLPPADLTDIDGNPASLEAFRGRRVLLVNWSPYCGFCERIAPDFVELQTDLEDRGIELVLLAIGDAEPNRDLLDRHGLECTVLRHNGDVAAFYGVGTPSAYVIDEAGKVASALTIGADTVPGLARALAGKTS
jgi:peroxiredoxin